MKRAVFYCENCRKTVPLEAIVCPHCGSRFTAVQCPQCAFVGEARLFSDGCPQCGFLGPAAGKRAGREAAPARPEPPRASVKREGQIRERVRGALPGWCYSVASILLVLALLSLVFVLLRMR